jgi:hypothetical protein
MTTTPEQDQFPVVQTALHIHPVDGGFVATFYDMDNGDAIAIQVVAPDLSLLAHPVSGTKADLFATAVLSEHGLDLLRNGIARLYSVEPDSDGTEEPELSDEEKAVIRAREILGGKE